jgi:hypothetical protein
VDTNYGTVGASTLRTAAQIGNATGAASFGAGATGAQTLRTASNLYDGAGTALTSTLNGGKQSLDVNASGFLGVTAVSGLGIYVDGAVWSAGSNGQEMLAIRHDATGPLSGVADGDFSPLQVNANGELKVAANLSVSSDFAYAEDSASADGDIGAFILGVRNDANAVLTSADGDYGAISIDSAGRVKTVTTLASAYAEDSASANADIGDFVLAVRQDTLASSVSADGDYGAFKINSRGALWAAPVGTAADNAADSENPVKVGSRALTGSPAAVSANNNRADLISDDYRRIYVNSGADIAVTHAAVTVGTSAVALPTTAAAGRRKIYIQNLSNKEIYIGGSGVTTSNGLRVAAGAVFEDEVGDDVALYGIAAAAGNNVRVFELS